MTVPTIPSRWTAATAMLAVALLAGACRRDDPRVANLAPGISRDSVLAVMGGSPPERPSSYLVDGQFIEAILYRGTEVEGPFEQLERRDLTPVILVDGEVTGWGWEHWDSVAAAHGIEVTPKR